MMWLIHYEPFIVVAVALGGLVTELCVKRTWRARENRRQAQLMAERPVISIEEYGPFDKYRDERDRLDESERLGRARWVRRGNMAALTVR